MKKKIRHINVDGNQFNWRVSNLNESHISLRVWVNGFKRLPWFTVRYPYRDPWLNFAEIIEENGGFFDFGDDSILQGVTPGKIAKMISHVLAAVGKPDEVKSTLVLEWDSENQCPKI